MTSPIGSTQNSHVSSFNKDESLYHVELSLDYEGSALIRDTLAIGLRNVTNPLVRLAEPDGIAPDGTLVQNISRMMFDGSTESIISEKVDGIWLSFENPLEAQFEYELVVYADPNQAPVFTSSPTALNEASQSVDVPLETTFRYLLSAEDPELDEFTYSVEIGPAGAAIMAVGDDIANGC